MSKVAYTFLISKDSAFVLIFLFVTPFIEAGATYISLLQNKNNPEKFVLLPYDNHKSYPDLDKRQINITKQLIDSSLALPNINKDKIETLVECSEWEIPSYKKPVETDIFIAYVRQILAQNVSLNVNILPCDSKERLEDWLFAIQGVFFTFEPNGFFENGEQYVKLYQEMIEGKNSALFQLQTPLKEKLIEYLKQSIDSWTFRFEEGKYRKATIDGFIQLLEYEQKKGKGLLTVLSSMRSHFPNIPIDQLSSTFDKSLSEAREVLQTYAVPPESPFMSLVITLIEKNSQYEDAERSFRRLINPASMVRNLHMLTETYKSQTKANLTIVLVGALHALFVQNNLSKDYREIFSADLISNLDYRQRPATYNPATEDHLWNVIRRIKENIPWLQSIIEEHKKSMK